MTTGVRVGSRARVGVELVHHLTTGVEVGVQRRGRIGTPVKTGEGWRFRRGTWVELYTCENWERVAVQRRRGVGWNWYTCVDGRLWQR